MAHSHGSAEISPASDPAGYDAIVVGAGFAGLYMLYRLRRMGLSARIFEAGSDVGGTWYWNRYPGARCDVESMQYSYSFSEELQQDWDWSERFASQGEIQSYLSHVADRFDLRRDIEFDIRVTAAAFEGEAGRWQVTLDNGRTASAQFCIMATGCLSAARMPQIPGVDNFGGRIYHTAAWPKTKVDLSGQRVGVIGTGSSGMQLVPVVARDVAHLHVFQRTPHFSVPARNAPIDPDYRAYWKSNYPRLRNEALTTKSGTLYDYSTRSALSVDDDEREKEYRARWQKGGPNFMRSFNDLTTNQAANDTAAEFVRSRIAEIVSDGAVAERLMPTGYPIGTKRICVDSGYFETFNRENVSLVDLRFSPIERITTEGVATRDAEYSLDSLIFATGFDAMTGALLAIDIRGREGLSLRSKWANGPRNFLGLMAAGFPNLFTITGPGSPSVLSNMVASIEQHVDWIANCLDYLLSHDIQSLEAEKSAEDDWVAHVNEVASKTLYPRASSWYMGANIEGKPKVFMPYIGGFNTYRDICLAVAERGYDGFRLRKLNEHNGLLECSRTVGAPLD